eukprot:jgi/Botrbrau1/14021/Bobra.0310s0008.1
MGISAWPNAGANIYDTHILACTIGLHVQHASMCPEYTHMCRLMQTKSHVTMPRTSDQTVICLETKITTAW